jgi:hypothetical protein
MSDLSHEQLCERARRWLSGTRRCEPVFSNIASCGEVPDAIGWSSCHIWYGSTVVECKTSRSDFHADQKKYTRYRSPEHGFSLRQMGADEARKLGYGLVHLSRMGDFRFYLCEPEVITSELIQKHAPDHGLLYVEGRRIRVVRQAVRREPKMIDKDAEIRYLRFSIINRKLPYQVQGGE